MNFAHVLREIWHGAATPLVYEGRLRTPFPTRFVFVATRRCNSRCQMCRLWQNDDSPEITVDEIRRIFSENDFASLRSVSLTGGEPILRADLPEVLQVVLEGAPNVENLRIATNGLLPRRVLQQVEQCWDVARAMGVARFTVQVSLDGIGEIHDRIRGIDGAFKRVQETLRQLINLRGRIPSLSLVLGTVVQPMNKGRIAQIRAFAGKLGLPVYFSPVVASSDYYGNLVTAGALSLVGDRSTQHLFDRLAESARGVLRFHYRDVAGILRGQTRSRRCMMGYYAFVLEADGNVHPCVNCEHAIFGNLLQKRFQDIWWGNQAEQLRAELRQNCCATCPSMCYLRPVSIRELTILALSRLRRQSWKRQIVL